MKKQTTHRYRLPVTNPEWTEDEIKSLCYNMVKEAINNVRDSRIHYTTRQESKEWLMSNDTSSPFSATNCCDYVGLDIHTLRWQVNRLTNGGLNL